MRATASEIVRCLISDGFSLEQGAAYARRIGTAASFNPWSEPGDAEEYLEAARRLEARAAEEAAARAVPHPADFH